MRRLLKDKQCAARSADTAAARKRRRSGVTLVEVMVSIVIIASLAVAVPMALSHPRREAVVAARQQAAVHAANEAMERILSKEYADIVDEQLPLGQYSMNGQLISTAAVEVVHEYSTPNYKHIRISVGYVGGDSVVYETYIAQRG